VPALNELLARHGFDRLATHPDTLPRLADRQTQPWAAWEERALKSLWRLVWRLQRLLHPAHFPRAPWFDAYYRARPSFPRSSSAGKPVAE
jgi:hypothetical protein